MQYNSCDWEQLMQIDFTPTDRKLTLMGLKLLKPFIHEPKTAYAVRQSYKELLAKLKRDEGLSQEIQDTVKHTGIEPTRPSK